MKIFKIILLFVVSFIITVSAVIYQRLTGPTHPFKETITLSTQNYILKLPRSLNTQNDTIVKITTNNTDVKGVVQYRVYPSDIPFFTDTLQTTQNGLEFSLPTQKAAGKIEYQIKLWNGSESYESPFLLARYKDPVPSIWLVLHIAFMFLAMFFAVVAALKATFNYGNYSRMLILSGILLFLGGLVLGPIIQKYAFGEFWTGIPFGWDLTDNKTLITMLAFIFAIFKNYKKKSRTWTIVAVVILLLVYSIPHSVLGSELDPKTGKVMQGRF